MNRFACLLLVLLAGTALPTAVRAADSPNDGAFDNPKSGDVPCVVLNRYEVVPTGTGDARVYDAVARVENVCARSVELRFCFVYANAANSTDRRCFGGPLRPFARSDIVARGATSRIVANTTEWRFIP